MSVISAAAVNELRKKTDQPLMDCKKALTEAGGDMEKAVALLAHLERQGRRQARSE